MASVNFGFVVTGLALVASGLCNAFDFNPQYHFVTNNVVGHSSGLVVLPNDNSSSPFPQNDLHLLFQDASMAGHQVVSSDFVRWQSMMTSSIQGSGVGGVSLSGFQSQLAPSISSWKAVAFSSSAAAGSGISVFYSESDMGSWKAVPGGSCAGAAAGVTGIICPSLVPATVQAGFLGDVSAWTTIDAKSGNVTLNALVGSNRCPSTAKPGCGKGFAGAVPQTLLFTSMDAMTWTFDGVFFLDGDASATDSELIETFALYNPPAQIAIKSDGGAVTWMLGTVSWGDTTRPAFQPLPQQQGSEQGVFTAERSITDAIGRRVQYGWIPLSAGQTALSLPRQVSTSSKSTNPYFGFLSNVYALHGDRLDIPEMNVTIGSVADLMPALQTFGSDGLQLHLRVSVKIPSTSASPSQNVTASIEVLGGQSNGGTTISITPVGAAPPKPPAPMSCNQTGIYDGYDSDNGGGGSVTAMNPNISGLEGAKQCQALCCAQSTCERWTYTDPQPNSKVHDCWLKTGPGGVFPSQCGNGHCWSGQTQGSPNPPNAPQPLLLTINNMTAVPLSSSSFNVSNDHSYYTALIDVFIDGEIIEVFANEGEHAIVVTNTAAVKPGVSVGAATPSTLSPSLSSPLSSSSSLTTTTASGVATFDVVAWKMAM